MSLSLFLTNDVPIHGGLGAGYALLRSDESVDISGFVDAAKAYRMPLDEIDIEYETRARDFHDHALVLVRPNDRVTWRNNTKPPLNINTEQRR